MAKKAKENTKAEKSADLNEVKTTKKNKNSTKEVVQSVDEITKKSKKNSKQIAESEVKPSEKQTKTTKKTISPKAENKIIDEKLVEKKVGRKKKEPVITIKKNELGLDKNEEEKSNINTIVEKTEEKKASRKNKITDVVKATNKEKVEKSGTENTLNQEMPVKKETITPKKENKKEEFAPTVRYSDEELAEFAKIIIQEKENALEELRMLKERLEDLTSLETAEESMIYSMHMGEQGSEAQEKEKTYAQIQRIHEYIKKLEDAMERIKNKTYGICRVCGCLIAKERLRAVPITTLSASYKIHQRCPEDGIDRIEPVKK